MTTAPPKVFLSHASEDRERFVIPFAAALRGKGVDVWFDRWEILPGDSLVQKIFEEGLKNAAAVIVVLSEFSVGKRWVREELDSAVVKRINSGSKLIPVVLDNCAVPQVLQATVWEKVTDLNDIGSLVDRVAAAIFNHRPKPPLGSAPVYSASTYAALPGLSSTDAYVLAEASRWIIENDEILVDPKKLFLQSNPAPISEELLIESSDILERLGYLKLSRHLGPGPYAFRVLHSGLELYLANCFPRYDAKVKELIALIVNQNVTASDRLAEAASIPHRVAHHIVSQLESRGHLKTSRTLSPVAQIYTTSPSLKRILAS
jgi:hypothetical protein